MSNIKIANFTADDIRAVADSHSIEDAKSRMNEILDRCSIGQSLKPMKPTKIGFLRRQIDRHKTIEQIAALGYQMLLVGEGFGTPDSWYQRYTMAGRRK